MSGVPGGVGWVQCMVTTEHAIRDAVISGPIGLIIGVVITAIIAAMLPTPWTIGQVLLAVGTASFCAAGFSAYGAARRR